MTSAQYRKLHNVKEPKPQMNAEEWRVMMKKKASKPQDKNRNEIAMMLKLARIDFEEEYTFHPTRKWRFDFAIVEQRIAVEYEGIFSKKSRHTTITGFIGDNEKYNEAVKLGWRILRYTAKNYKEVVEDVRTICATK